MNPISSSMRGWWQRRREDQWRVAATAMYRTTPPLPAYYEDLLTLASVLLAEDRYGLAVIVAQMACEIAVEQALAPRLTGASRSWNFNVDNRKVRKEYIRLTGDVIDKAVFWPRYHDHAVRRHQVTHAGGSIGLSEAEASVTVAREFVQHVEAVRRTLLGGGRP
jgi:hypothetical protein